MASDDSGGIQGFLGGATTVVVLISSGPIVSPLSPPPSPEDGVVLASWWLTLAVASWFMASVLVWGFVLRSPSARLSAVARRVTLPGSRKIAESTLALSLVIGAGACSIGPGSAAPTLTLVSSGLSIEQATSSVPTSTTSVLSKSDTSTSVENELEKTSDEEQAERESADQESDIGEVESERPIFDTEYEVRDGDNLWSIAQQTVSTNLGAEPTTKEIASYWRELVASARESLASSDPNLIYPGEILVLPTPGQ